MGISMNVKGKKWKCWMWQRRNTSAVSWASLGTAVIRIKSCYSPIAFTSWDVFKATLTFWHIVIVQTIHPLRSRNVLMYSANTLCNRFKLFLRVCKTFVLLERWSGPSSGDNECIIFVSLSSGCWGTLINRLMKQPCLSTQWQTLLCPVSSNRSPE